MQSQRTVAWPTAESNSHHADVASALKVVLLKGERRGTREKERERERGKAEVGAHCLMERGGEEEEEEEGYFS